MAALSLVALQACQKEEDMSTVIGTGTCGAQGDNLTWTLDEDGTLTIKGEGDMEDYDDDSHSWGIYFKKAPVSTVVIQDGVTSIGNNAFQWCETLTSVSISESVTRIGEWAFSFCDTLTSVTIPKGVTSIEDGVFGYSVNLTSVSIPEGVTSIGEGVFVETGLTSITIPESVTSIGEAAFANTELTEIKVMATTPPFIILEDESMWADGDGATFYGVNPSIPVYVPASSVEDYRNSTWGQVFSNIQPM